MKKNKIEFSVSFTFFASAAFFLSGDLCVNYAYALLFSLFHEAGHLSAMAFFGCFPKKISLEISGIRIDKTNLSLSFFQECTVSFCGPIVNFVLMLIFSCDVSSLPFVINTGLAVVNLLPVKSLDGGRFLYYLLLTKTQVDTAERILLSCEIISCVSICLIIAFSLIAGCINASFVLFCVITVTMIMTEIFQYKKC